MSDSNESETHIDHETHRTDLVSHAGMITSNSMSRSQSRNMDKSSRSKRLKKLEPFHAKKARAELELVEEDEEDNYYGDRVRSDRIDLFEFVKQT
eukprot:CAMPEP_0185569882 /NCGR_PEP_ID=MMETSP0434-20130131/2381_1 /TAXON_ID=626734 ORGANISM="Favella taraikaensis, Strain Fe Narragansett Bay" /NCGR_SAMPLE_ID=MMETSP0434 /ASSEMBLY_ACC=CAM_ASM_000379 /LENGTH=94 /DNA_ID=CAMNT_0028184841 /DNA_START=1339 /DNA_END=1623 /DNA_ORIENTATION=-